MKEVEMWSNNYKRKLILPEQLEETVKKLRAQGKKIVSLNGSFDLLHAGHLQFLYEAAQMGDVVIAALNSDASIKAYKSPKRPLIPLEYRMQMMAALEFIDYVTWFEETDPRLLLAKIRPDVHVNGADWGRNCIEKQVVEDNGGKLHIVELVPGLSTTKIIDKIRSEF